MNNIYEFTENEKDGLFQVRAKIDSGSIKEGDLGGWVSKSAKIGNCGEIGYDVQIGNGVKILKNPLYIVTPRNQSFVNCCGDGNIQIGCQTHSYAYWLNNYESIGKKYEFTDPEIILFKSYIDLCILQYPLNP